MHLEQLEKRYRDSMDGKGLSKMVFPKDDHFAGLCVAEMRLPFLGMPSCPLVCPEHTSPEEAQCSGSFMWATTALLVGYCHCFDMWDRCLFVVGGICIGKDVLLSLLLLFLFFIIFFLVPQQGPGELAKK